MTVDLRNIPEDTDDLEVDVDGNDVELSWDDAGDDNITGWQYNIAATANVDDNTTTVAATEKWMDMEDTDAETDEFTVMDVDAGTHFFAVRAVNGDTPGPAVIRDGSTDAVYVEVEIEGDPTGPGEASASNPADQTFAARSSDPGDGTRYDLSFTTLLDMNTLTDELVIELEDFDVSSSIGVNSVAVTVDDVAMRVATDDEVAADDDLDAGGMVNDEKEDRTTIPEDVSVSGEKIFITIGDLNKDRTGAATSTTDAELADFHITSGSTISVVLRESAGINNPTEAGGYGPVVEIENPDGDTIAEYDFDAEDDDGETIYTKLSITVPRKISLSEEDGGLGTVVTATGKGYKNSTTLTVFRDELVLVMWDHDEDEDTDMKPLPYDDAKDYNDRVKAAKDKHAGIGNVPSVPLDDDDMALHKDNDDNALAPNRNLDLTDEELCAVNKIGSNDVGKCDFTIAHPTFAGGLNYVNAVDGRNGYAPKHDTFELTASIEASPDSGSPGEIILIQVVDFSAGSSLKKVTLGRQDYCGGDNNPVETSFTCPALTVDSTGSGNFKITVPNWARSGVQELKIFGTGGDDGSQNVTIGGPVINVTPGTIWANQRISLVGTGFSSNAVIGDDDLLDGPDAENDLSKISIGGEVIKRSRISDGEDVEVDSGGNWSASVDLPLSSSTTAEGERAIRVTDSGGRSGVVTVTILARTVTITPSEGRVGTIAAVRGEGFPSKNDEGSSFNVEIVYDAGNDKETTVSAVPDASGEFEVQLRIPTTASIPSSNTVKVTFEDDDGVAVVTTVAHDVPEGVISLSNTSGGPGSTVTINGEGFKTFVPISLVKVGTLDVTPAPKPATDGNGMMSFDITIPGLDVGIQTIEVHVGRTTSSTGFTVTQSGVSAGDIKPSAEAVEEMGDNFVRAFNFNNDTKTWTFYDPAAGDASTLNNFITGESYWILIKATQEVILNRETRNLTCVDGNCWNQIVW